LLKATNKTHQGLLFFAIYYKKPECVHFLLARANEANSLLKTVIAQDTFGQSPLIIALNHADETSSQALLFNKLFINLFTIDENLKSIMNSLSKAQREILNNLCDVNGRSFFAAILQINTDVKLAHALVGEYQFNLFA